MKKRSIVRKLLPTVVVIALAGGAYLWFSRPAPTPAIFDESVTIQEASLRAAQTGQVVLAVVTADFCPTCQAYKRSALSDSKLASWVQGHAQTVYLEWDREKDRIAQLGVKRFPATLVLDQKGAVVDMRYGPMSTEGLISFLEQAQAQPGAERSVSNTPLSQNVIPVNEDADAHAG